MSAEVSLVEATEFYVVKILRTYAAGGVVRVILKSDTTKSTATESDYTAFSTVLQFNNNEIEKNVTINLKPDVLYEYPDEFIHLELEFEDENTEAEIGQYGQMQSANIRRWRCWNN